MFEKGKLSFWDIGTYLTVGCFASFIIAFYVLYGFQVSIPVWFKDLKEYSGTMVVVVPIIFLLVGMLIEPLANSIAKTLEKQKWFKPRGSRYKNELLKLIVINKEVCAINPYRFCKAVVELKFQNSNHEIFLARFGFYRSVSFILALLFMINWFLFVIDVVHIIINLTLLIFSYHFFKRSQVFLNHMEEAVYYNYLALVNTNGN